MLAVVRAVKRMQFLARTSPDAAGCLPLGVIDDLLKGFVPIRSRSRGSARDGQIARWLKCSMTKSRSVFGPAGVRRPPGLVLIRGWLCRSVPSPSLGWIPAPLGRFR